MDMRFSEQQVYLIGVIVALLISVVISMPVVRYMLRWYWSHPRTESYKEIISKIIFSFFICVLSGWVMFHSLHYPWARWVAIIGSVLESLVMYPFIKRISGHLMTLYAYSFNEEEKEYALRIHQYTGWYFIGFIFLINLVLTLGGIFLARWAMPDVVEVRNVDYRASYAYDVDTYCTLPFVNGLNIGESYIDNLTIDTIYRLVVTYGYSGEDRTNHYSVKEQYPPHSFSRMKRRTMHVMDTIAPWMPASKDMKTGRYRTQRVYLTDYMHLQDFISVDMRRFGLYGNERVDAIEESRNLPIYENMDRYRAYKAINPYPYIRLLPDSLRKRKKLKSTPNEKR